MLIILTLTAAITLAFAQAKPTVVLTQDQIQELEVTVAQNPGDLASQALLGKNYAFFILGITSLGEYDRVAMIDPGKAAGTFALHARDELGGSARARVVAEGGQALWRFSTEVESYQILNRSQNKIDVFAARALAVQSLDRAISMEPSNGTWRTYRIPILISRSQFKNFMPLTTAEAYRAVKQDLSVVTGFYRSSMLAYGAQMAVRASELDDASDYAQELLKAPSGGRDSGYAVFFGNMVLGQVALRQGRIVASKEHLLAAGKTPGAPTLNSFGPNMSLARDLLAAGEREAVLAFLDECRAFWKLDRGRLKKWADDINSNHMPDFGANLLI